jgi:mannitol 2-dehydrogenase
LPVVHDNLASGGEVRRSAAVVASWARYAEGVDEDGAPIDVRDVRRDALRERALRERTEPLAFLRDRDLFGDLADDARFTVPYREALTSLYERGARATLEDLVGALDPAPLPATGVGT